MAAKSSVENERQRRKRQLGGESTESLVRKLVEQTARARPVRRIEEPDCAPEKEVIFACEVDGVRCVLERSTHQNSLPKVWLSPRETEIARMVAKGYPNKTISAVLEISIWTVSTHLRRTFTKLGVNSRAAMVGRMIGLNLLR